MTKSAFFRTFSAGALLVGSVLFGWLAVRQREVLSWVSTEGEGVGEWTETSTLPPQQGKYVTVPPREVTEDWVSYSYRVDGRRYTGKDRIGSGRGVGFRVYYDPDHPEESRIDRPEASPWIFAMVAGMQLLGAIVVGAGPAKSRNPPAR
jgi:hypothetical protein